MNIALRKKQSLSLSKRLAVHSKEFCFCLISVLIWGLIAHLYGLMQDSFSHDVLNALYADSTENIWKVQIGRYLVPVYRMLTRGAFTIPWIIGMLSFAWIAIAAFLITRIFDLKSKFVIFAAAGILTTNICVSCLTATYVYELDIDMFALLTAAGAVYLWKKGGWSSVFPGGILCAVTLALYQSYISVSIVLILFSCIFSLLTDKDVKGIWYAALRAAVMLLLGAVLYAAGLMLSSAIFGSSFFAISNHSFNSLSNISLSSLVSGIVDAYRQYARGILFFNLHCGTGVKLLLAASLTVPAAACILARFFSRNVNMRAKLLVLLFGIVVPIGTNFSCIFNQDTYHTLMSYSFFLTYVFFFIIVQEHYKKASKIQPGILKCVFVCGLCGMFALNICTSNALYMKKDLEQEATLSLMTRVLYRMEEHHDYVTGETPVAFIGKSKLISTPEKLDQYSEYTGMDNPNAIRANITEYYNTYKAYFNYKLFNPAQMCDTETWRALYYNSDVLEMPIYPEQGSLQLIDGVFVVKLGNVSIDGFIT